MRRTLAFKPLGALILVLAGCQPLIPPPPAVSSAAPGAAIVATQPLAYPGLAERSFVSTPGGGTLAGRVSFQVVVDPFFQDNAAAFRLLAMPTRNAMVTLTTVAGELLTRGGKVVSTLTDPEGKFSLVGLVPTDRPCVVHADLALNHRMAALVLPAQASVEVDEASTAVTAMIRSQMEETRAGTGGKAVKDLTVAELEDLIAITRATLKSKEFTAPTGQSGSPPLKLGNESLLRSHSVAGFGGAITRGGTTAADQLSDDWKRLLGFRPLALTSLNPGDELLLNATGTVDIVADHAGNLFVTQPFNSILFIPKAAHDPWMRQRTPMTAGKVYQIAGNIGISGLTETTFNARYRAAEAAAVADPIAAPLMRDEFPLLDPYKLVVERAGTTNLSHLFLTSKLAQRVFLIPAEDLTRYGRSFKAGRLYTLAGLGISDPKGALVEEDDPQTPYDETRYAYPLGDGGPAHAAALNVPTGLAQDSRGNLYVLDTGVQSRDFKNPDPAATYAYAYQAPGVPTGRRMHEYHGAIRLIRASDGRIFSLRLAWSGQSYVLNEATDLKVVESAAGNFMYITNTDQHQVFRVPLPADLATLDSTIPGSTEIESVLGTYGKAGRLDLSKPGAKLPTAYTAAEGVPEEHTLLTRPTGLAFDAVGNLLVADHGRISLLEKAGISGPGRVYTLMGAFESEGLEGDARLISTVSPLFINLESSSGDMLVSSRKGFRLWLSRGSL